MSGVFTVCIANFHLNLPTGAKLRSLEALTLLTFKDYELTFSNMLKHLWNVTSGSLQAVQASVCQIFTYI